MGEQAHIDRSDPMRKQRQIHVRLSVTNPTQLSVILLRNGQEIAHQETEIVETITDVIFEDNDIIDEIAIREAPFHPEPFVAYYARIEDPTNQTQWTSPIWIDI